MQNNKKHYKFIVKDGGNYATKFCSVGEAIQFCMLEEQKHGLKEGDIQFHEIEDMHKI